MVLVLMTRPGQFDRGKNFDGYFFRALYGDSDDTMIIIALAFLVLGIVACSSTSPTDTEEPFTFGCYPFYSAQAFPNQRAYIHLELPAGSRDF